MDEPLKITPRARESVRVVHREPIHVQPRERDIVAVTPIKTIWERAGWAQLSGPRGLVYTGTYRVIERRSGREREFEGRIECLGASTYPYVRNPPRSLLTTHPKYPCFHPQGQRWWRMNWYQGTSDIDETIAYMTQLLDEAVNVYR